jgi:hypothetical protein
MRLEALWVLSVTCAATVFAVDFTVKIYEAMPGLYYVDFTVKNYEDTPGLYYVEFTVKNYEDTPGLYYVDFTVKNYEVTPGLYYVDFTVKNYEDTPGLYYDHISQVQLRVYSSEWKLVTYVNISKLGTTYNMLVDSVAQRGAICKELPPEAICTCQSDLSLMNQSVSKIHSTRGIISDITNI